MCFALSGQTSAFSVCCFSLSWVETRGPQGSGVSVWPPSKQEVLCAKTAPMSAGTVPAQQERNKPVFVGVFCAALEMPSGQEEFSLAFKAL